MLAAANPQKGGEMKELKKIELQIARLQGHRDAIRDKELIKKNKQLVGKCFKFRNSYSCPEPDEYWFIYKKVLSVKGPEINIIQFGIDYQGKGEFKPRHYFHESGWIEISEKEYSAALKKFKSTVAAL